MSLFNILTPTYNRAHTLDRVYNSLVNQTEKGFKWIIVDDCSTDATKELVNSWQSQNIIAIEYYPLKKNQRKAHAVNYGLPHCAYEYTIIADSDDSFSKNTLSDLKELWDTINLTKNSNKIASIWTLSMDEDDTIIGDLFPRNFWQANLKERVLKRKIKGEKWHCWRTKVLQEYELFSDPKSYVFESATWNRINRNYDFLCVNLAHRDYYYSDDGIMATRGSYKNVARSYYYSTFYELSYTPIWYMLRYNYYRKMAFEHVKSTLHYKDKSNRLNFLKKITAIAIFICYAPFRIIKKMV